MAWGCREGMNRRWALVTCPCRLTVIGALGQTIHGGGMRMGRGAPQLVEDQAVVTPQPQAA